MASNEDIIEKIGDLQTDIQVAMSRIEGLTKEDTKLEGLINGLYDHRNDHRDRLVKLETLNQSNSQHRATLGDWVFRGIICLVAISTFYTKISDKKHSDKEPISQIERRLRNIEVYITGNQSPIAEGLHWDIKPRQ